MATKETKKEKKEVLTDKDNPSLCEISGQIRLRVFEDFSVEKELPKWVRFKAEWEKLVKDIGIRDSTTEYELENKVKLLTNKTDEEKAALLKHAKILVAMNKAVRDDRYDIRGKHEREVDAAILKQAKFVRSLRFWDRVKGKIPFVKKPVPVTVAMDELIGHIELTSTDELAARLAKILEIEANMRKAGQYKKADAVKAYRTIIAEEAVVVAAGFTSYITESNMIDFIRKSERGTMVDFLRYYEDELPQEVIDKKLAADKLMVFDNYVVAYYSDLIHRAVATQQKVSAKEEQKVRERRRDPILFGVIKNSRKLYYICDWTTDTDDLTLEKLEKELGITRSSLVDGASTRGDSAGGISMDSDPVANNSIAREVRREINQAMQDAIYFGSRMRGSDSWGFVDEPLSR